MVVGVEGCREEQIRALRGQISQWRLQKRHLRERMPEALWEAAVEVGGELGASKASKLLGIAYGTLRQRLEAVPPIRDGHGKALGGAFVELQPWAGRGPIRVEVERPDGSRLRLEVTTGQTQEATLLMQAFLTGAS